MNTQYVLGLLALVVLYAVIVWDVRAWLVGEQSVSDAISTSWMAWPTGIAAFAVCGFIVIGHFVKHTNFPGK
jgi:heme A synthase